MEKTTAWVAASRKIQEGCENRLTFTGGQLEIYERMMKDTERGQYDLPVSPEKPRYKQPSVRQKKLPKSFCMQPKHPRRYSISVWHSWEDGEKHGSHPR